MSYYVFTDMELTNTSLENKINENPTNLDTSGSGETGGTRHEKRNQMDDDLGDRSRSTARFQRRAENGRHSTAVAAGTGKTGEGGRHPAAVADRTDQRLNDLYTNSKQ